MGILNDLMPGVGSDSKTGIPVIALSCTGLENDLDLGGVYPSPSALSDRGHFGFGFGVDVGVPSVPPSAESKSRAYRTKVSSRWSQTKARKTLGALPPTPPLEP